MSINSLTEADVRRHVRREAALNDVAVLPEKGQPGTGVQGGNGDDNTPAGNALSMLIKYIPTETITLYVAALSAAPALKTLSEGKIDEGFIYGFFGALTPILFALILLGKRRAAHVKPLASLKDWPWWKNIAATVAFLVWALAVPGNPIVTGEAGGAVAGFFAIFISTVLSILEQIFDAPATPASP